ncbi:flagellar motor protein MotS [Jeotgalibacillus haloalkalitolerans]|uniref:Flagellar motor protein MotS n=1 Tax=Jeotgalibacillus haloalkalitolerans TaxID=3104292 RepID=A0ABU5KP79_9BACL|nr:flagellar motor protein MotS [Jeotgalibacillus sp. HH7-29]MDZ5712500.1 flagellar motor protein MotS [Jeotgalibacillus sp. HH7-29]
MAGRKRFVSASHPENNTPKWMVTFADFMMLILVFFILLFSISQVDEAKFDSLTQAFKNQGIFDQSETIIPFDEEWLEEEIREDIELQELYRNINAFLEENNLTEQVTASETDRGVVITLQEQVLFDSGRAELLPEAEPVLQKVGDLLEDIPNFVRIEGHTDNRPIQTAVYPSNWELSGARASSVVRYMQERYQISSERFAAVGYGDTRPVAANDGPEGWAMNRRVEVVILNQYLDEGEAQ